MRNNFHSPFELITHSPVAFFITLIFCFIASVTFLSAHFFRPIKIPTNIESCPRSQNPKACYETFLIKITEAENPETAFAQLKQSAKNDPYIEKNYCHDLAHAIGRTAAIKYKTFSETNKHADDYCAYGYYHGMVGTLVASMGKKGFFDQINSFCNGVEGRDRHSFDYFTCTHGIGHGTTILTYYAVPDALKLCDALHGTWEQTQCYNGAFMENLISSSPEHPNPYVRDSEPMFPCTVVAEKYREQCYHRQPHQFLKYTKYNFNEAFKLCSSLENQYKVICFQGMGREAFSVNYNDISTTRYSCDQGDTFEQRNNCALEAVKYFIDFTRKKESGDQFCQSLSVDLQSSCFSSAEIYAKTF